MSNITNNNVLILVSIYFMYVLFIIFIIISHNRTHYYELVETEEIDMENGKIERRSEDEISEDSIINNEYF